MLRRLGLRAEENGHNASRSSIASSDSSSSAAAPAVDDSARKVVVAPAVDYDRPTKYFKVVYRGSVGVRSCPTEPAPPDGQVSTGQYSQGTARTRRITPLVESLSDPFAAKQHPEVLMNGRQMAMGSVSRENLGDAPRSTQRSPARRA